MLQQYKKEKKLKGYKIAKQKFSQNLERDIIYHIVVLCGEMFKKQKSVISKLILNLPNSYGRHEGAGCCSFIAIANPVPIVIGIGVKQSILF